MFLGPNRYNCDCCSANVSEVVSFMRILTWQVACASGGGGRKRHCWVQDIGDWRNILGKLHFAKHNQGYIHCPTESSHILYYTGSRQVSFLNVTLDKTRYFSILSVMTI